MRRRPSSPARLAASAAAWRRCCPLGHHVVGIDLQPAVRVRRACDEFGDLAAAADEASPANAALVTACAGAHVVVHCAAWPGPSATPPPAVVASGAAVDPNIGLEPPRRRCCCATTWAPRRRCATPRCAAAPRVVFSSSAFALGFRTPPRARRPLRRTTCRSTRSSAPARELRPLRARGRAGARGGARARRPLRLAALPQHR